MADIKKDITELIGQTPIVKLSNIEKKYDLNANILAKLEYFNPGGSAKDRVALNMINRAEESGTLKKGATIIEPTSGNTGIGIALVAAARGYNAIMVMPDTMSVERIKLTKAYGANVVLTEGALGMAGSVAKAEELAAEIPGAIIAGQFVNPANPEAHYLTTGPEIWQQTDGEVDFLVCGVGTGGTITGTGAYLKEKNPDIKVIAMEPSDSPLLSGGKAGPHAIQGIGANFVPETLDTKIYDEIITITKDEAFEGMKAVAAEEGVFVGISSGAALMAAIKVAKREENAGKNIVVVLVDTGERYLSVLEG
ncbi:MAG: cysteine synthase A [Firmicutes bacterium]|nr:cysteine synthase A [Bacillota bacterium]MBQ9973113.1 cysteine synthase A [Bacillota bacterium]